MSKTEILQSILTEINRLTISVNRENKIIKRRIGRETVSTLRGLFRIYYAVLSIF